MKNEKEKKYAMREPIPREFRTTFEHIEYWLFKHGISSMKMYCKWFRTLMLEGAEIIELDTENIKFVENKE